MSRLKAFADNVFDLKLHLAFAAFWSLSLLGNLYVVSGIHRRWDATLPAMVLTVFLCLFFLRVVDEIKDYDYDVVHNPMRPLVSGLVTRGDLARYLVLFAAVVLSLNGAIAWPLVVWLALDLAYGLLQLALEKRFAPVRDNVFVNLLVVYPVNVGLSIYTVLYFLSRTGAAVSWHQVGLVAAYACAFLHFELARKSGWPQLAKPGERLYSQWVGLGGSLAMSTAFALTALGLVAWLLHPWACTGIARVTGWLPMLALVPMVVGLVQFARNRHRRHAARPAAVAFLFTFYPTMLIHALA